MKTNSKRYKIFAYWKRDSIYVAIYNNHFGREMILSFENGHPIVEGEFSYLYQILQTIKSRNKLVGPNMGGYILFNDTEEANFKQINFFTGYSKKGDNVLARYLIGISIVEKAFFYGKLNKLIAYAKNQNEQAVLEEGGKVC